MSKPSPKADALRALREQRYEERRASVKPAVPDEKKPQPVKRQKKEK